MRKSTILLFVLCYVVSLAGCGSVKLPASPTRALSGFVFSYKGTAIAMNAEAAPILAALGEPESYTEQTSCAFDGLDKTYFYSSFYITTYPKDGADRIYRLWFADDLVSTAEGISIGDPRARVEEVYGSGSLRGANAYTLASADSELTILITDGLVSSVQYEAILNP